MITNLIWGIITTAGLLWLLWQAGTAIEWRITKTRQRRKRRQEQKRRLNYCRKYYSNCVHYVYTPKKNIIAALMAGAALIDKQRAK